MLLVQQGAAPSAGAGALPLVLALLGAAVVLALVLRELRRLGREAGEPVARLESRVAALTEQLGARLGESSAASTRIAGLVQAQLSDANRSIASLAERIGRLDEATRHVERVGRSIAGLEQLLASPKLRGGLGEWTLESMLGEILPADAVARQHPLPSRGVVVDVAVRAAGGRVVAIDSKFPLESFRRLADEEARGGAEADARRREFHRSVRARVDEIAKKYISPEDGTLDFALMYVPAEAVYYEIAVREEGAEFLEYARLRRVVPCSPNTLYAYLQATLLGLRGAQVARHAREIQDALAHLGQDLAGTRELFDRAASQLRHAVQNVDAAGAALARAETRVEAAARVELGDPRALPVPVAAE